MSTRKPTWQQRIAPLASIPIETPKRVMRFVQKVYVKAPQKTVYSKEYFKLAKRKQRYAQYNITEEDFKELWKEQNGQCGICQTILVFPGCIDHDHRTGIVRGILCNTCNRGLGFFKDHPEIILEAANYLSRHNALVARLFKEKLKS